MHFTKADCFLGILSIRDGWDHYLLILACLYSLWVCGGILWEEYGPNFHRKKRKRENGQNPSEPNDAPGVNRSILGKSNFKAGSGEIKISRMAKCIKTVNKLLNVSLGFGSNKLLNFFIIFWRKTELHISQCCSFFGCHKQVGIWPKSDAKNKPASSGENKP